jgi:cytoskeletal protein RodZ
MRQSILAAAVAAALGASIHAPAYARTSDEQTLAQIRAEIKEMKEAYEARIQALEKRVQEAEAKAGAAEQKSAQAAAAAQAPAPAAQVAGAAPVEPQASGSRASPTAFNPAMSLILGGTWANLSEDPNKYRLQGFIPGGEEIGTGKRSFNLGESELTLSANIDTQFAGHLIFSLANDNSVSVEEAVVETQGLSNGFNLKAGRFLSSIGYLNSQHAHAWDFVDAPLAYQAFFGGQYKADGVQLRWLAPTDRFFELGAELGSGAAFPGNDRNKNGAGAAAVYAHVGDDIGESASWRAGVSYLHTGSAARSYDDIDSLGNAVTNAFDGSSKLWIVDGIYKWAPNGNATQTNFKLQGEYFRRKEDGTLTYDTLAQSQGTTSAAYASAQSGWYLQGVYQFMPLWRAGLRYDKLHSGTPDLGLSGTALTLADFQRLSAYNPSRTSIMFDYSPSEFSRFRLQLAQDKSRPEATDHQIFLQYIMSLGVHGAHSF